MTTTLVSTRITWVTVAATVFGADPRPAPRYGLYRPSVARISYRRVGGGPEQSVELSGHRLSRSGSTMPEVVVEPQVPAGEWPEWLVALVEAQRPAVTT